MTSVWFPVNTWTTPLWLWSVPFPITAVKKSVWRAALIVWSSLPVIQEVPRGLSSTPLPLSRSDESEVVRVWDAEVLITEKRVKRLKTVEEKWRGSSQAHCGWFCCLSFDRLQNCPKSFGEAFSTRKRKQAIVSLEKNKVRADSFNKPATEFITQPFLMPKPRKPQILPVPMKMLWPVPCCLLSIRKLWMSLKYTRLKGWSLQNVTRLCRGSIHQADRQIFKGRNRNCPRLNSIWTISGLIEFYLHPRDDGYHTLRLLLFGHFLTSFRALKEAAINGPDGSVVAVQSCLLSVPEPWQFIFWIALLIVLRPLQLIKIFWAKPNTSCPTPSETKLFFTSWSSCCTWTVSGQRHKHCRTPRRHPD